MAKIKGRDGCLLRGSHEFSEAQLWEIDMFTIELLYITPILFVYIFCIRMILPKYGVFIVLFLLLNILVENSIVEMQGDEMTR